MKWNDVKQRVPEWSDKFWVVCHGETSVWKEYWDGSRWQGDHEVVLWAEIDEPDLPTGRLIDFGYMNTDQEWL